jgi:hypothetical protein
LHTESWYINLFKSVHLEDQGKVEIILNWMSWGITYEGGRYELVHVHDHVISGLCIRNVEPSGS